ncbi:mycothiol system anti-sigma-R factor [Aeromicrobium marinum DSM 15272]|uniref:Mycothiol system anti-sigma-R factor n=1 Tax=Aeromicrobium marinum DSM 15272 TaxID=585531 RepID=E2SCL6_9ACTN|nr:mycothiol system anti-sigma-R factor [Aeromicrobium marinum]EFQ82969.1 mycothiol system anti-sigma-R factor [Aeromicrobium marinum DSM 15272]
MSGSECEGPDCGEALQNLYLFLDREIDDATCEEIQSHLDDCSTCLTAYDLEHLVKTLVSRSCSEVAPEPLREKVLRSIRTVQVEIADGRQTVRVDEVRVTRTRPD